MHELENAERLDSYARNHNTVASRYDMGQGGSATTAVRKTDSIVGALDCQEKYLSQLHQGIDALEEKLALLMEPDARVPGGAPTSPPPSSQIVQRIGRHSESVLGVAARLARIYERIQL